ncbi:MAG: carboxypeptidase regulatory-like domain-containing protein [Chitinophagales bacterium]|jgi:outer membrane protein OmpA-like peptidoglycan-associated protein|nr:carboxypeptidase regulatory-like domain-containing protein [Chitinophagales bacterium]
MIFKKTLITLLVALLSSAAFAESPIVKVGDWYFKQFDYQKAILFYERALKKDDKNVYVLQKLADSYRLINNAEKAESYYAALASKDNANVINKLYYAESLRANQKYAEAKVYYKQYIDAVPNDASVKARLKGIDQVEELSKDKGFYEVQNMTTINSPYSDFGVSLYKDTGIFFCSNRFPDAYVKRVDNWTHNSFLQIYQAFKDDSTGKISKCDMMRGREPNKKFHEGTSTYNQKMDELYIDRSNYNGKRAFPSADKTVKLKIYRIVYLPDQSRWGDELIEAVPFNDKEYSVGHPSLSKDAKTLYFASDKPGGYGGVDIYYTTREIGGNWSTPVNLGPKINTSGDEMFPHIANDGVLYFASTGHVGLGGLDIYSTSSVKTGNKITTWTDPENLAYPINTNADDFGYVINADNKKGYFCSNRANGQGDDDIYSFVKKGIILNGVVFDAATGLPLPGAKVVMKEADVEKGKADAGKEGDFTFPATPGRKYKFYATMPGYLPAEVTADVKEKPELVKIPMVAEGGITLEVTVIDRKTKDPLETAKVKVTNLNTKKDEVCTTNKDGKCVFTLEPNTNYGIEGSKETGEPDTKYLTVTATVSTIGKKAPATLYQTLELEKVRKGVAIKIENIYYDLDKWFIRPDAAKELDKLVKIMKDNPTMEIELSSHTDCRATAKYNMQLSSKRAESAVNYIASQGVEGRRMIAAGYGESRLVNKCQCEGTSVVPCTDEQHQENRRTEFKILKF